MTRKQRSRMNRRLPLLAVAVAVALWTLAGCGSGDAAGRGSVEITIWGEEYIERGIPAEAFEDGWSVEFDEFLVMVTDIHISEGDELGARFELTELVDLVNPGPHRVATFELE